MLLSAPEPGATHSLTLRTSYSTSPRAQPPPGRSPLRTGAIRCPGTFYAPALPLQDLAYSYRVWITLIKLPYAPLRHRRSGPDIHPPECICGRLLHASLWVSEKNSCRKLVSDKAEAATHPKRKRFRLSHKRPFMRHLWRIFSLLRRALAVSAFGRT